MINNSPSHIYHSALPLSPSSSWFHKCYSTSLMVKVVKGLPAEWGLCSRTVLLSSRILALAYHNNTIAVGSLSGDIIILDAITGSQKAVLSEHTKEVNCLAFSSDGTSLASGSDDNSIKLWDLQTGGVVKTFSGHTHRVWSIYISADLTTVASGSADYTICLWNIQTGKCHQIIRQQGIVDHVCFSPIDLQHLISVCGDKVWQWDTNGHQIKPPYNGSYMAFSSDGTQFVSCYGAVVTVKNSDSGVTVAEFHVASDNAYRCCFSPDARLIAVAASSTVYIWNITSSDPHLVETFIGHTGSITSLTFSSLSSLISASEDQSVKFWQIGTPSTDLVATDPKSTSLSSAPVKSVTLGAKDGITITSDSDGMVKTWDVSTGLCKASFQTPAKDFYKGDVQLIDSRLIFVCYADGKINIWDVENGKLLLAVDGPYSIEDLRISGDGSRVFCLDAQFIHAWSIQTGEAVSKVKIENSQYYGTLTVDGSKVWAHWPQQKYQGWDFGISGSSPIQLSNMPALLPSGSMFWDPCLSRIKDAVTGKVVFQLSGSLAKPINVQCDGYYLAAIYGSGEILILDFNHVLF